MPTKAENCLGRAVTRNSIPSIIPVQPVGKRKIETNEVACPRNEIQTSICITAEKERARVSVLFSPEDVTLGAFLSDFFFSEN